MHLLLLTRGINQQVELWKKFMETQMFWWKRQKLLRDKDGNLIKKEDGTYERGPEEITRVQGALRPIQLWEYVFPEECYHEVLAMLDSHHNTPLRPEVKKWAWLARKMTGAKPLPKVPDEIAKKKSFEVTDKFIPGFDGSGLNAVAVYPFGIRYDYKKDMIFPNGEAWYQEGL